MKFIITLALSACLASPAIADDNKVRIGSLPLKDCCVMVVEEYMSKAKMPQKVLLVSSYEDVYAFNGGKVTKVLEIDGKYSVFIRRDDHYFVYNNLKAVAVEDGDQLGKGDFIGETRYNNDYDEYQMEMQVWYDNGSRTVRMANDDVVSILKGAAPFAPRPKVAKVLTHKKKAEKHAKFAARKNGKKKIYATKSTAKGSKKIAKASKMKVAKTAKTARAAKTSKPAKEPKASRASKGTKKPVAAKTKATTKKKKK